MNRVNHNDKWYQMDRIVISFAHSHADVAPVLKAMDAAALHPLMRRSAICLEDGKDLAHSPERCPALRQGI